MSLPRVSLQALDAFERVALAGSMQVAAREMGLSISVVSHHIARLEEQLGVVLLDRTTRPFNLTREGTQALEHLSKGLLHLRRATSETVISGLTGTRSLTIGIVEDFESSVTPALALILARQMPHAVLSISTILSHDAAELLRRGEIDLAVSSSVEGAVAGVTAAPILRDPFVMAVPKEMATDPANLLSRENGLPFLRFNPKHLIGKQIEAHLARSRIELANRYSFDSVQSIMAVIAGNEGWSLITPLGYMRARRFAESVRLDPLPLAAFARTIALTSRAGFDEQIVQAIAAVLRQIIQREVVGPASAQFPWLDGSFVVIEP